MKAVSKFVLEDLDEMAIHPHQLSTYGASSSPAYRSSICNSFGQTLRIDGRVIFCGGVLDLYPDPSIGHLWSIASRDAPRYLLTIHRCVQRFMELTGKSTLVATTEASHYHGCRWLELLGFRRDDPLPAYGADGSDHILYLRKL